MPNKEKNILQPKNDVVFKALFSRGKPRIDRLSGNYYNRDT